MTERVLLVALDDILADRIAVPPDVGVHLTELDELERSDGDLTDPDHPVIAVVVGAGSGPGVAQAVRRIAPEAAVLIVAAGDAERDSLQRALAITPNIGRHTRSLAGDDPELATSILQEIELARRRLGHRRTVERVRGALSDLEAATAQDAPRYLGQLFTHAPIGILVVDPSGRIEAANPRIEDVLGWAPHHAVGNSFTDLFSGEAASHVRAVLARCTTTGELATEVLVRTGPMGNTQHVEVRAAPVDPDHPELGAIVLLTDESERVGAVEHAEHARVAAEAAADRYATVARTLQESLLPPDLPDIPGVELAALFHPAGDGSQIGGDFYDVFQLGEHDWFAVVGDVCGKGAAAARLTALARYTLRAAVTRSPDLERNLIDLNSALLAQHSNEQRDDAHRFVTVAAMRLRPTPHGLVLQVGVAGHPRPIVVRADGRLDEVECAGRLLGMFPDIDIEVCEVTLGHGDVLVTFTDGVTEARRGNELFGEQRLRDLVADLAGASPQRVVDTVGDAVLGFQVSLARDDIAVLALSPISRDLTLD